MRRPALARPEVRGSMARAVPKFPLSWRRRPTDPCSTRTPRAAVRQKAPAAPGSAAKWINASSFLRKKYFIVLSDLRAGVLQNVQSAFDSVGHVDQSIRIHVEV